MRLPRRSAAIAICLALAASGCGSDDTASPTADSMSATESGADATTPDEPTESTTPTGAAPTPTGAEICERLTLDAVANDLGLEVTGSEADDSGTPQCAYDYTNTTGMTSNLTVAAMRPDDVGGVSGEAAFDVVVAVNRSIAGDEADEASVAAGDHALRLTGSSLHLGVIRVGDQVFIATVAVGDAEASGVEQLMATMATALG